MTPKPHIKYIPPRVSDKALVVIGGRVCAKTVAPRLIPGKYAAKFKGKYLRGHTIAQVVNQIIKLNQRR